MREVTEQEVVPVSIAQLGSPATGNWGPLSKRLQPVWPSGDTENSAK
jgi:hypothetical protein